MSKNSMSDKINLDDIPYAPYTEEETDQILNRMIQASQGQMEIALSLTKLIVEKTSLTNINETQILAIFKQSLQVVNANSPLKQLLDKMN